MTRRDQLQRRHSRRALTTPNAQRKMSRRDVAALMRMARGTGPIAPRAAAAPTRFGVNEHVMRIPVRARTQPLALPPQGRDALARANLDVVDLVRRGRRVVRGRAAGAARGAGRRPPRPAPPPHPCPHEPQGEGELLIDDGLTAEERAEALALAWAVLPPRDNPAWKVCARARERAQQRSPVPRAAVQPRQFAQRKPPHLPKTMPAGEGPPAPHLFPAEDDPRGPCAAGSRAPLAAAVQGARRRLPAAGTAGRRPRW